MTAITVPVYPTASLQIKVQVSQGTNQIQQNVGNYNALFLAESSQISQTTIELAVGQSYSSPSGETAQTIVVSSSAPLVLDGTMNGVFVTFNIKKILVLDSDITNFSITNAGTASARVSINYLKSATVPGGTDTLYFGVSTPPGVINDAFVRSLTSVVGVKNRTFTVNASSTQKIYYAYPAAFGLSSFTSGGFEGGFVSRGTTLVVTDQGPISYIVYESDNLGLGNTTVIVTDFVGP